MDHAEIIRAAREVLLEALKHGRPVVVTSFRKGQECATRGKVAHVNDTTVIVSWRTGETVIRIEDVRNVEETKGDES